MSSKQNHKQHKEKHKQFGGTSDEESQSLENPEEISEQSAYRYASSSESILQGDDDHYSLNYDNISEYIDSDAKTDQDDVHYDDESDDGMRVSDELSFSHAYSKKHKDVKKTKATPQDFNKILLLGKGAVGKVYLVKHNTTEKLYAMKVLSKEEMLARNKVDGVLTEREILCTSDHPSIVTLYYCFQSTTKLIFIMEYCAGGEFYKVIQRQPSKCLTEDQTRFYAAEVLTALEYLHNSGYVYRDLKPENILMHASGHIKLTDFDLSKAVKNDEPENQFSLQDFITRSFVGTEEYIAPEILKGTGYGSSVDWWTFGILMFEMLYGRTPFRGQNRDGTFKNIRSGNLKLASTKRGALSRDCKDLLKKLLHKDIRKRLGAGTRDAVEIKKHAFFKGTKFHQLHEMEPPIVPRLRDELDFRYFTRAQPGEKISELPSEIGEELESQNLPYDHPWKQFKSVNYDPAKENIDIMAPVEEIEEPEPKKPKRGMKKKKKKGGQSSSSSSSSNNIKKAFLKFLGVRKSSSSSSSSSLEKKKKKKYKSSANSRKFSKSTTLKNSTQVQKPLKYTYDDDSATIPYDAKESDSEKASESSSSEAVHSQAESTEKYQALVEKVEERRRKKKKECRLQ
eukprot:TRINITY_DN935_c0_g1_i1.p1 TRINITY_DN935_c0_g1~~TRINITY_DN935_c0_g1_i1.p1  ORF type:complete len:624 (-),score=149.63 TRINITY_DN935_c0_g1_i1:1006-2877(-)